jgi:hypothetical protein
MHHSSRVIKVVFLAIALLMAGSTATAQANRPHFIKAFVVDDRLSALRQDADSQSPVLRRLRLGRPVLIIESRRSRSDKSKYYRVAATRRTRGWIHEAAIAAPGRAGEDERLMRLIKNASDGVDRITLCNLFLEHFNRSALAPRAWLEIGEEADRAAATLTRNARKRLKDIKEGASLASLRDYYLNDAGLDRYSKLSVVFNFTDSTSEYAYDGKAYREIVRRFPNSEEARIARSRLGQSDKRLADQK